MSCDGQGRDVEMLWSEPCASWSGPHSHAVRTHYGMVHTHVRPGHHGMVHTWSHVTHTGRVHCPLPDSSRVSLTKSVTVTNVTRSRALRAPRTHATHAMSHKMDSSRTGWFTFVFSFQSSEEIVRPAIRFPLIPLENILCPRNEKILDV